ncbi:MAG: hypothetical protein RBR71_04725 [Gudongella sp.]|nr:hypothetical protein [Gudongella sp.]
MNKKVIVYGNNILSEMLYYDAKHHLDFVIAGFTVDWEYLSEDTFMGLPQVSFDIVTEIYPPDKFDMIAVRGGYTNMRSRREMYLRAKEKGYLLRNYISPTCDITPTVKMGDNNLILGQSHVGVEGSLGSNNVIRQQAYLGHGFLVKDNSVIGVGCNIGGFCTIEDACYLGIGSTVINNTRISKESLIGAGSLVIRHTEPYSKNVGNPSKIIGYHKEEGIRMKVDHE